MSYQCRDMDPDHGYGSVSGSSPKFIDLLPTFLKISRKSVLFVRKFLRKVANKQTNNDDYISSLAEVTIKSKVQRLEIDLTI